LKGIKNHKIISLLSFWLLTIPSFSLGDGLSSPKEIIERAKKSSADFISAVGDIERLAPTLTSKEAFFPYISILDELEEIGKTHGVNNYGTDPVQQLSFILTRNGVKWLRLDLDPPDFIQLFLRRSENSTRYQVSGQHIKLLALAADKQSLLNWFERSTEALNCIKDLKSEAYVIESFEELQANSIQKLIKIRDELTPEELNHLFEQTRSPTSIQSVIAFLSQEVLRQTNVEALTPLIGWVSILGKNLKEVQETIPFYVLSAPGQLINTIIAKVLTLGKTFSSDLLPSAIGILLPTQITELGGIVMSFFQDRYIPEEQIDFLVDLSTLLLEKYTEMSVGPRTDEMRKFVSRVVLLQSGLSNRIEGTYDVMVRDKPGLLTLVHLGNGRFFMGLSVRYGGEVSADFSFFYVTFDGKTQTWEAAHYDPSDPETSNPVNQVFFMHFTLKSEGTLNLFEGKFFTANLTSQVSGKQTGGFLTFDNHEREPITRVEGVFEGSDKGTTFRLVVHQVQRRLQAILVVTPPSKPFVRVDLEYGTFDPRRNVAYLTSGRFESLRWVQIRGEFLDGGKRFEGQYIQSVYGVIHQLNLTLSEGESK